MHTRPVHYTLIFWSVVGGLMSQESNHDHKQNLRTEQVLIVTEESLIEGNLHYHKDVRLSDAGASFPWVQIDVKSCRPDKDSATLGCEFVNKIAWAQLLKFG